MNSDKVITTLFIQQYQVTVTVNGEGTVTPESGLYDEGSEITLTATPDEDWAFDRWSGDLHGGIDRYADAIAVQIEAAMNVYADFIERPGLSSVDMVSDLGYFLTAMGQSATVETFDRNRVTYDETASRVYTGNGIPDVAELYLLDTVLKTRHLDLTHRSGIAHEPVWDAWQANLAQAQTDLAGQDARVIRVVAGYMTLGDFDNVESVRDLVETQIEGVTLDPADYDRWAQRFFWAKRDADNDGVSNIMEWETASPTGSLDDLDAFAAASLDGDATAADEPEPPAAGCDNAGCVARGGLSGRVGTLFQIPDNSAVVVSPSREGIVLGSPYVAMAQPDHANKWAFGIWIPYTGQSSLLKYSRNVRDFEMLQGELELIASFLRYEMEIPRDSDEFQIEVVCEGGAKEVYDPNKPEEPRKIYGPPWSYVTLTATSRSSQRPFVVDWEMKTSVNSADPRYSCEPTVRLPVGWYARPRTGPAAANTKRIELSSDEGGMVLGSQSTGWGGAFRDSITAELNSQVDFAAWAEPGWEFVSWEPNIDDDWDARRIPASTVNKVKATFRPKVECMLELEIENAGGNGQPQCAGYVTVDESKRYYSHLDDPVTLTAIPEPGYEFSGWEGDYILPTSENPLELDVAEFGTDRRVKAIFLYDPVLVMQGTRRILETNGDLDHNEIPDNVALISAAPEMPALFASLNGARVGTNVEWRFEVSFDPDGQSEDVFRLPTNNPSVWQPGLVWDIGAAFANNFRGGDAVLWYRYCGIPEDTFEFLIWGTNPSFSAISQALAAAPPFENKYRAIAWHESAYRQFLPDPDPGVDLPEGGGIGMPLPCGAHDGGYGLMQLTQPQPTIEQIWNWRANAVEGIQRFNACTTESNRRLSVWNATFDPTPNPPITMTPQQTLLDSFSLYRKWLSYWKPERIPGTDQYILVKQSHTGVSYADGRWEDMSEEPWEGPF